MKKNYFLIILISIFYLGCRENPSVIDEGPALKSLGDNVYLHQSDMAVEFRVAQGELEFWNNDKGDITKLTSIVCKKFAEDFDFIIAVLNNPEMPTSTNYAGFYATIKNDVTGIGGGVYDYSKSYGSGKQLKGVITLPAINFIKNGPTLHELGHYCAKYVVSTYIVDKNGKQINYDHWGYCDAGGQMGGFKSEFVTTNLDGIPNKYQAGFRNKDDGFGINSNGRNRLPYSKIELYLLGLIPKTDVPPLKVYSGLSVPTNETRKGVFFATDVKTYTVDDIIATHGERVPSVVDSQKKFRILTVIVTDRPVSQKEWEIVNSDIEWFTKQADDGNNDLYNYWEATGGRATVKMDGLKNSLK